MVTRAKPLTVEPRPVKRTRGRPPSGVRVAERATREFEQKINSLLIPRDYEAIIAKVPLKEGADKAQLRADIRRAAVRAEMPKKTAPRQRATLNDLARKLEAVRASLNALHGVLKTFPPKLRVLLHEVGGPCGPIDWRCREAWRSPTADVETALDRLIPLVEKASQSVPVRTGPKLNFVEPLKLLLTAWKNATGASAFTESSKSDSHKSQMDRFLSFAHELIERLNKAGYRIRKPTKDQATKASNSLRKR